MFQDEARFGRMAKPRRCWAPKPCRPVMLNGYEREFVYAYGAVSPREGSFDWKVCPQMNTQRMSEFLEQVGQRYPHDFIVMIVDGASSRGWSVSSLTDSGCLGAACWPCGEGIRCLAIAVAARVAKGGAGY